MTAQMNQKHIYEPCIFSIFDFSKWESFHLIEREIKTVGIEEEVSQGGQDEMVPWFIVEETAMGISESVIAIPGLSPLSFPFLQES